MKLSDRIAAFKAAYAKWPASWPYLVKESGREVLYATWLIGNDYRNPSKFYGSYPPGYLDRVLRLFPEQANRDDTLHVFSGALPKRIHYVTCDIRQKADIQCSVYDLPTVWDGGLFGLVLADPPYSAADAAKYETGMVDRRRATAALAQVTRVGGHLVWLDTVWPMHRKEDWVTVGRIAVVRSTNHRFRMCTIFRRVAA